ncbi:MAG: VWA domain-containing protein [Treponema sp.]|nr:VWA domain-containing protein [Treponema sp.]
MTFEYPFFLTGLLIFIPIFILDITGRKKRILFTAKLEKKLIASRVFFRLFLFLAIFALAGPRWGLEYTASEYRSGLDIVFAIDVSRSMDIHDIQVSPAQSRLERGLLIAKETVLSVSGARYAAAIGRSRGYLAIPLTYDNEASLTFLETLDGSSMTGRSTNLENLIEAACAAFLDTSPAQKIIILISDGESHGGVIRNAVNNCIKDGIIVIAVAVGSDEGQLIQERLNDPSAPMIISRRDSAVMRAAAERTGGIYIDGNREDASSLLSIHLLSISRETTPNRQTFGQDFDASGGKKEPKQHRSLFIIFAILAYGASKFVTRQSQKQQRPLNILLLAFITSFVLPFTFTSCSEGKLLLMHANYLHSQNRYDEALISFYEALNHEDAAAYAEYGLGLTYYLLDFDDESIKRYNDSKKLLETFSANEHRELRYRNHYNSGIILFEKEDYISAANEFREALRIDSRKIDAKRNLELTLLSITMMETNTDDHSDNESQRELIFDYIRQEEQQSWKSREWAFEETFTGSDY